MPLHLKFVGINNKVIEKIMVGNLNLKLLKSFLGTMIILKKK